MKCAKEGCKAPALIQGGVVKSGDVYCYWHSQKTANQRKLSSRKGGKRHIVSVDDDVPIETVADIKRILADVIRELRSAPSESIVSKARAIGYIASVMMEAIQKSDIEGRLSELERLLTEQEALT